MAKNIKFHGIAISIITVVVVLLYLLIGPENNPDRTDAKPTDRFIRISSATWGMGCNPQIEAAQLSQDSIPQAKDANGKVIRAERLQKVVADNALPAVKEACEGRIACEIQAYDDTLGVKLLAGCYRQLIATYRCSDMDRIVNVTIDQGRSLKINCASDAAATAPQHP